MCDRDGARSRAKSNEQKKRRKQNLKTNMSAFLESYIYASNMLWCTEALVADFFELLLFGLPVTGAGVRAIVEASYKRELFFVSTRVSP